MFNLSTATRPVTGSTLFSAMQQLFARIGAGVHRIAADKTGAVACATAADSGAKPAAMGFFECMAARAESREAARREAYLAGATDIYDLEYRIAYLDRRSSAHWASGRSSSYY